MIRVNGREVWERDGATHRRAARRLGVEPDARGVAVAVDGEVVPRGEWADVHGRRRARGSRRVTAVQGG